MTEKIAKMSIISGKLKNVEQRWQMQRCRPSSGPPRRRCRVTAGLLAVVDESLGVGRDCAFDGGIIPVLLRGHPLGVDISAGEREATHSMGVDSVLLVSDMPKLEFCRT